MTDKVQLIKEEIKSYKESMKGLEPHSDFRRGQITAYNQIIQFIDSIPEEHNEDLEEELDRRFGKTNNYSISDFAKLYSRKDFKNGAEWQKQKDQEIIELAEDHAMLAGMNRMKEEMMKDAVDGQIYREYVGEDGISNAFGLEAYLDEHNPKHNKLHDGDKVKIIIIKTEQQ